MISKQESITLVGSTQKCWVCGEFKDMDQFCDSQKNRPNRYALCLVCQSIKNKVYHSKPGVKEKKRETLRMWQEKNRERVNAYARSRKRENARLARERRRNNPDCRIREALRKNINGWVKGVGRCDHSIQLLGCDFEFFKRWIAHQFWAGMNWENFGRGGWNLDHITPLASFANLHDPEQQRASCHWSNLQPLWESHNKRKSDKILPAIDYQI